MLLPIVMEGDPILRRRAIAVTRVTRRVQRLVKDMFDTMYKTDNGAGLAAPQVGVPERIIVIDVGEGPLALINPELHEARGEATEVEGCLSMPGKIGYVTRAAEVLVTGVSPTGRPVKIRAVDPLARTLQHEIDHLDGVLFTDKATGVRTVITSPAATGLPEVLPER